MMGYPLRSWGGGPCTNVASLSNLMDTEIGRLACVPAAIERDEAPEVVQSTRRCPVRWIARVCR